MVNSLRLTDDLNRLGSQRGGALLAAVDELRLEATQKLEQDQRSEMGQFLTPKATARLMAEMLECAQPEVSLLDAGAGIGTLMAAAVEDLCKRSIRPKTIHVVAYEVDQTLIEYLKHTASQCKNECDCVDVHA